MTHPITIIGAGLAGSEAAWQCARRGVPVTLYEMRPVRSTPAHQTEDFAELVCSNSLKSSSEYTAPWLLKEEMTRAGSLLLEIARQCAVPAGHALAVDRVAFSQKVTSVIASEPLIAIRREEVTKLDASQLTIIATGPLTSDNLAAEIAHLTGSTRLFFYDSISPIVEADSIDRSKVYMAARYDKGTADYINCPMTKGEYDRFLDALLGAESVDEKDWEKLNYFEGCLPNEDGRPDRPAHRKAPIRRGAVAAGESARGFLQLGGLPESSEVRRPDGSFAFDSWARTSPILTPRPDSPQYLHQWPGVAPRHLANETESKHLLCRTDLWRRRLCRIDRHWASSWYSSRAPSGGRSAGWSAKGLRLRVLAQLRNPSGPQALPARQHNLRPPSRTGNPRSRTERAPPE